MKKLIFIVAFAATSFVQKTVAQDAANQAMQDVITAYLDVKNLLIKDNGDSVRIASKTLYQAINNVPMEKLSAAQHKSWMQYKEKLSYDAEHIKQTDELVHQRAHFAKLSVNFYKMLKALNINAEDLYYQYCPMANDGKGAYWISENEKIRNPYFGKQMMTCGSTKETLKSVK